MKQKIIRMSISNIDVNAIENLYRRYLGKRDMITYWDSPILVIYKNEQQCSVGFSYVDYLHGTTYEY